MEIRRKLTVACFISALAIICHGLESASKRSGKAFGASGAGFGQPFPDTMNLQSWKDFMNKRSFSSGFTNIDAPSLATWNDWMEKKSFSPDGSFTNIGQIDGSQFQKWTDWLNKRGLSPDGHPFGKNAFEKGFPNSNLQSWSDVAKRSYFGNNYHNLGNGGQLQTWNDWMKRSMGGRLPFGMPFGGRPYLATWHDLYNRVTDKRQFSNKPSSFGSFNRYFTDGLQDWRSTFKGAKRVKDSDKEAKN